MGISSGTVFDMNSDEAATNYDEISLWSAPFGQMILDRVPLVRGQTVVDIGSGTGFLSVELAQRCGTESTVFAVDPWRAGMDILRRKCNYLQLENVICLDTTAERLSIDTGSVDVVVSNLGINNFDAPGAVLRECRRVMKPGGKLLLSTNLVGHMQEFYDTYRTVLTVRGREGELAALDWHPRRRATPQSLTELISAAGLAVTSMDTGTLKLGFADGTALLNHYFMRLAFMDDWRSVVGSDAVQEVMDTLERNLNDLARRNGALTFTVPMTCLVATRT